MKKQRKQRDVNCEGTWPRTKTRTKKTGENFLTSYNRKTYVYVGTCSDAVHSSVDVNIFDVTIRSKKCFSGTAATFTVQKKMLQCEARSLLISYSYLNSFISIKPPALIEPILQILLTIAPPYQHKKRTAMVLVSPLSARLLGLQSVDGSLAVQLQRQNPSPPAGSTSSATTNTDSKMAGVATSAPSAANMLRHNMKSHRSTKPRVRSSGYAADQESNSASSNNSCAGLFLLDNEGKAVSVGGPAADPTGTKHRRASQIAERARKRKVDEMNYAALTVKEALEMAGKSYKYTSQLRSRALPVGSVDMSNVRLVTAGVYREMQQQSHQPVRVVRCRSTSITSLDEEGDAMHVDGAFDLHVARYSTSIYNALIQDTRQHYNVCPKKRRVSSANAASASSDQPSATQLASRLASVAAACGNLPSQRTERAIDIQSGHSTATPSTSSDTESDVSLGALEVPPRLEEGLMSDVTDEYTALSPPPFSVDKASIIPTTIETALSYSQKAR